MQFIHLEETNSYIPKLSLRAFLHSAFYGREYFSVPTEEPYVDDNVFVEDGAASFGVGV